MVSVARRWLFAVSPARGRTVTSEYIQHLRIAKARELLQFTTLTIDRIAWDVGYSDVGAFRKVFSRLIGLTPSVYRDRFRA